jgi:hypothetical protein
LRRRFSAEMRAYIRIMGEAAGSIMAAIIASQIARKSPVPAPMVRPIPGMSLECCTTISQQPAASTRTAASSAS